MSPIAAFLLGALVAGVLVVIWAALVASSRDDDDR